MIDIHYHIKFEILWHINVCFAFLNNYNDAFKFPSSVNVLANIVLGRDMTCSLSIMCVYFCITKLLLIVNSSHVFLLNNFPFHTCNFLPLYQKYFVQRKYHKTMFPLETIHAYGHRNAVRINLFLGSLSGNIWNQCLLLVLTVNNTTKYGNVSLICIHFKNTKFGKFQFNF